MVEPPLGSIPEKWEAGVLDMAGLDIDTLIEGDSA
jgi:hypothetical protein